MRFCSFTFGYYGSKLLRTISQNDFLHSNSNHFFRSTEALVQFCYLLLLSPFFDPYRPWLSQPDPLVTDEGLVVKFQMPFFFMTDRQPGTKPEHQTRNSGTRYRKGRKGGWCILGAPPSLWGCRQLDWFWTQKKNYFWIPKAVLESEIH